MIDIQMVLLINVVGLACTFFASVVKISANMRILISNTFLYASAMSAWWMIVNSDHKVEPKSLHKMQKILSRSQTPYTKKVVDSPEVETTYSLNESGLEIISTKLKRFRLDHEVEILNPGYIQMNLLNSDGDFIERLKELNGNIVGDSFSLQTVITQNGYVTNFELTSSLPNSSTGQGTPKTLLINYNLPLGSTIENMREGKKLIVGYRDTHWAHIAVIEGFLESKEENGNLWTKVDLNKNKISIVSVPLKIKELKEAGLTLGVNLQKLLHFNSGFLGFIKGPLLYFSILIFDYLVEKLKDPLLAIFIMLLMSKIILIYPSYRSYLFSKNLNNLFTGIANDNKDPTSIMKKLRNNVEVPFAEQALWIILKISSFLLLYAIIQKSPNFYKASFLWVKDLSSTEDLNILSLFKVVDTITFMPKIGLTAIIATVILTFELVFKKKENNQNGAMMFVIPGILFFVFSRLQLGLCIYMTTSTIIDQVQSFIFARIFKVKNRKSKYQNSKYQN